MTRPRLSDEREMGGVSMGAFEVLLELLDVAQLESFTWTEAVTALRLMVGYIDKNPTQFALHWRRIAGGTQLAASQGISGMQMLRVAGWKSRGYMNT